MIFQRYLKHLGKLVDTIHILCSTCIDEKLWKKANSLLKSFVIDFEDLYGKSNMVYNVHQLNHLAECVRKNGPLFGYSNYPMEDYIGHLVTFVKGTTDVTTQICSRYLLEKNWHVHLEKSSLAKDYYNKIESKSEFSIARKVNESLVIGKAKLQSNLDEQEVSSIRDSLGIDRHIEIQEYRSVLLNGRIFYESITNNSRKRTDDSFIFNTESKRFAVIQAIIVVEEQVHFLIEEKYREISDPYCKYVHFLTEAVRPKKKLIAPELVDNKHAFIQFSNIIAASKFPNLYERN